MGERVILEIGTITLDWSAWAPWTALLTDARGGAGVPIPNGQPGVYEVKRSDHAGDDRLYIGKASDLRMRVRDHPLGHHRTLLPLAMAPISDDEGNRLPCARRHRPRSRSPDIRNWRLSPLSVLEPDPASEMASPTWPARHSQTGDGLGSWPAARRPDLHSGGQGGQFTAARPAL